MKCLKCDGEYVRKIGALDLEVFYTFKDVEYLECNKCSDMLCRTSTLSNILDVVETEYCDNALKEFEDSGEKAVTLDEMRREIEEL